MSRTLIAYTNPWSFSLAVERAIASEKPHGSVDVLDLNSVTEHSRLSRRVDQAAEIVNRKYQRFIAPVITGRDITASVRAQVRGFREPPLPAEPGDLRTYTVGGAHVGLGVLSSVTSHTTIENPSSMEAYGQVLPRAWRTAHLSERVGNIVDAMAYDEVYIFNGRHCISRPFCDILQRRIPVYRYEQGGSGNRYVMSADGVHSPASVARLIHEHHFDARTGEQFFAERFAKAPGSAARFFTVAQVDGQVPPGVQPGRTISLFTSSADELYAVSDTGSYGEFTKQFEVAATIAEACAARGESFVIRFHPHLQFKDVSWQREWDFDRLRELGAILVMPNDTVDSYALLRASRCIFSFGSTVGFEASYLGIPAADVGDWAGGALGAVAVANSAEAVRKFIDQPAVPSGARERAIRYGSYAKRAGKLLPELEVGSHPYFARIGGRIVDPVRYAYQRLRSPFSRRSRIALPLGGTVIVEPSVLDNIARRMHEEEQRRAAR
jgi:hypothetical protein